MKLILTIIDLIESVVETSGRGLPPKVHSLSENFSWSLLHVFKPHISLYLYCSTVTKKYSNTGPYRLWKNCIILWPIFVPMRKISTENSICSLVCIIHNRPIYWKKKKNWNNLFWDCFWYLIMVICVSISTLNTHTCHIIIFMLKFNHEKIKYLQSWFQDRIISVMYDIVICITQKSWDTNHIVSCLILLFQWSLL